MPTETLQTSQQAISLSESFAVDANGEQCGKLKDKKLYQGSFLPSSQFFLFQEQGLLLRGVNRFTRVNHLVPCF